MNSAAYARRQIQTRTQKEIMRIDTELYGRNGPRPALRQVVPGKYYNRGDCSHIRCTKCGTRTQGDRQCPACDAKDAAVLASELPLKHSPGSGYPDYPEFRGCR